MNVSHPYAAARKIMSEVLLCGTVIWCLGGGTPSAFAQQCVLSEPPSDFCSTAQVIPGNVGQHIVLMDVHNATSSGEAFCGVSVGHTVWFKVTPTASGPLTFSTCHPATTYDTVVQAYRGGESTCEFMTPLACEDDTQISECNNGCSGYGSVITFNADAGVTYRFAVGSYNGNVAGCPLCLGVIVTIGQPCDDPPITVISSPLSWPAPSGVACDNVTIIGSAYDPNGMFEGYTVEYLPVNGNVWIPIYSSPNPVVNGNLLGGGTWNTGGLSQGWYFLRLSAFNLCGRSSSVVAWLFVDKQYDNAAIRSPANGAVLGGSVCVDGTVWDENARGADSYTVRYAPLPAGTPFNPVDPAHLTYAGTVLNDPLASWNTRAGIADGNYRLRLDATDQCGRASTPQTRDVVIDNTAPIAIITSPTSCSNVVGQVDILGTASDAHLDGWALYYTGGDAHGWVTINSGPSPVINGLLGRWNTAGLRPCAYVLRLVVTDKSVLDCNGALRNQSEYLVSVNVGAAGAFDADHDGDVDLFDFRSFEDAFTGPR